MFHRPLGCYCSYYAAKFVTGTTETEQNIANEGTPHIVDG